MDTMLTFVGLVITTLVALFAALALQTLLLRAGFALMQPATASRRVPQPAVEHGTQLVARLQQGALVRRRVSRSRSADGNTRKASPATGVERKSSCSL